MVIYKVTNLTNQKVYIGQTNNFEKRKKRHHYIAKTSPTAFHRALIKYGFDNFKWEVLAECKTRTQANSLEKKFIREYGGISNPLVYNETEGGHAFRTKTWTERDRAVYSDRAKKTELNKKGRTPENIAKSVETRKNTGVYSRLSERQRGEGNVSKRTEVQSKIANSVKKLWEDPEYRANQIKKQLDRNPVVKCLYCEKKGRKQIMSRWHFDNCKKKSQV